MMRGWSISLCLMMMPCSRRAIWSAPPPVPAGTSIVLWLARAGRDPAIVDTPTGRVPQETGPGSPEEFRPGRRGSRRHLAFGAGPHRCLGDQLARMEAAVVVAETAPLLTGATVVRPPWCPDNLTFRMPDAFVIRRD